VTAPCGRALVIAHDERLLEEVRGRLAGAGYAVHAERCGSHGLGVLALTHPDVVVLDVALAGEGCPEGAHGDGFHLLRAIRARDPVVPVLVVSQLGGEEDKVRALELGADDYVTAPCGARELLARVAAVRRRGARSGDGRAAPAERAGLRESREPRRTGLVRFGEIEVDLDRREVRRGGEPVPLTAREADLLLTLAARPGHVVSREELLRDVWGYAAGVWSRTVDSHVAELRRKLEPDPSRPRHLVTVHKRGYRLRE
jgi:two-component system, OmpR family, alkaline phosphatase synthesis response regulator PhoP